MKNKIILESNLWKESIKSCSRWLICLFCETIVFDSLILSWFGMWGDVIFICLHFACVTFVNLRQILLCMRITHLFKEKLSLCCSFSACTAYSYITVCVTVNLSLHYFLYDALEVFSGDNFFTVNVLFAVVSFILSMLWDWVKHYNSMF